MYHANCYPAKQAFLWCVFHSRFVKQEVKRENYRGRGRRKRADSSQKSIFLPSPPLPSHINWKQKYMFKLFTESINPGWIWGPQLSRQNQKPHGKNKIFHGTTDQKPHGKTKYFPAKAKGLWFCRGYLFLPSGFWFCSDSCRAPYTYTRESWKSWIKVSSFHKLTELLLFVVWDNFWTFSNFLCCSEA